MTDTAPLISNHTTPQSSRAMAREIALEMVLNNELPNPDAVRKRIVEKTRGDLNPSALTMQSEIRAWYAEEFWPTYHAMGSLPADSGVPAEVRNIFQSSFQTMLVQLMAVAKAGFQSEREEFQKQIDEADKVVQVLQRSVSEHELRAAEAQERFLAEARAHAESKGRLAALDDEVRELNVKLHAAHEQQADHEVELKQVRQSERARADTQIEASILESRRLVQEVDNLRQTVKAKDASVDALQGENRRLVQVHATITAESAGLKTELANARAEHAKEIERMTGALRAAQAGAAHGERMKPTLRPAGGKAAAGPAVGRIRRTLHKPTRP